MFKNFVVQMDELKKEMENKLQDIKESLEQEKKEQLGAVKEVSLRLSFMFA